MSTQRTEGKKIGKKIGGPSRRKAIGGSAQQLVRTSPLIEGRALPLLITPAVDGVDLVSWAESNTEWIEARLGEHKSLLFRGFGDVSVESFDKFVKVTSNGPLLEYKDRSTPRETRGKNIYTSTVYPQDQRINLHNEGTYWKKWALKIYFCCMIAAEEGGQTPLADVENVYDRLDESIRRPFEEKGVMYVRNYNDGFGLPWQEVFQTKSREEVEAYCRENDIEFEWKGDDRLRTRQIRPAVRVHPKSGRKVWFNHGAFFHISSREKAVRETLLHEFDEQDLPYQTFYGDGSSIAPEIVEKIFEAYHAEQVMFPWQTGDVLLQDNMAVAHAREPYKGAREVLAAMTEPYSPDDN